MAHEIRLVRRIPASADAVYEAWTKPESLAQWMIPLPRGRTEVRLDVRVGGRFQIDMVSATGEVYPHHGEYLRLERPRLVELTWISGATLGQRSVVTVELSEVRTGETELTLVHRLLPNERACAEHLEGWTAALALLCEAC